MNAELMNVRGWGAVLGLALLVFAGVNPAAAQERDEPVVTLDEAIEGALEASPTVAQSRGAVRTASAGERAALGSFLPNLSLSAGSSLSSQERFNPQTNTTVTGSQDSYRAGASASLDLFTWGRRPAELGRARAETDAAEASLIEERFAVVLETKRAFFAVLRADDLIRVAESRVRRATEGVEAAERRLDVGSATRSDVLRARLERNQAEQALAEAETERRTATFTLGRIVGADGAVGARWTDSSAVRPLAASRAELLSLVEERSPAVRSARAAARAADAGVRSARTQYFPSLRLSAGSDWYNQSMAIGGGRSSWGLSLGLSYPLFNGFQRESQITSADVQARVADARLRDARRRTRAEVERLVAALELAERRLELAEEAVRVAEEDLRMQEERYRLGAATMLDRLASQASLEEVERDLVAARYDYRIARAEIEAVVGREL